MLERIKTIYMYIVGNGKSGFGFRTGFWNGLWPRTEVPLHFFKGFITFRKPRTLPIPWQGRPGHHHSISDFAQTPGLCSTSGQFLRPKKLWPEKNCARKGHFNFLGFSKFTKNHQHSKNRNGQRFYRTVNWKYVLGRWKYDA